MNHPTESAISELFALNNPEICRKIAEVSQYVLISNNQTFLTIGQRQSQMLFLVDGIARFYYMDPAGREHTLCFCSSPGYPLMVHINTTGSLSGAHAVGSLLAISMPADQVMPMVGAYPELMSFYNRVLNQALLYHAEIAIMLRSTTPQQRYQWLCYRMPEVVEKAQKRHIASFLGITPETLSRLRASKDAAPQPMPLMYHIAQIRDSDSLWDQVQKPQFSPAPPSTPLNGGIDHAGS